MAQEKKSRGLLGLFKGKRQDEAAPVMEEQAPPPQAPETPDEEALRAEQEAEKKAAAEARLAEENTLPTKDNKLYELYCEKSGYNATEMPGATFSLAYFMDGGTQPSSEQRMWLIGIEREARKLPQYGAKPAEPELDAEGVPTIPPRPDADAVPYLRISGDGMHAWLFVLPPVGDGDDLAEATVYDLLKKQGVTHGINEAVVEQVCDNGRTLALFEVATGTPPKDGIDGEVVDRFAREAEIHLTVKDDGTIDYKDLAWLQTVEVGDIICNIIPPVDAVPGTDVRGRQVHGRNGRRPTVPGGQGTRVNEEGTALVASIDGVVSYASQRFRVDPLLIIKGDVDIAVGNLDTVGDVLIHGDVLEGFTVKASGNITVQGMVEGALLEAGGSIQVGRGVNGNSQGTMQAKEDVLCKFIENANVVAGGRVICDNIINSTVSSDDCVVVKTGRGAIIGGSITALKRVEATTVGNQSNRSMEILLGSTANFLKDKYELEQKRLEVKRDIEAKNKNILYLNAWEDELAGKDKKLLDDLKLGLSVQKMQLANIERRLAVMEKRQQDPSECRLIASVIYPPVQISIGPVQKTLRKTEMDAVVYLKDGDVHVASVLGR